MKSGIRASWRISSYRYATVGDMLLMASNGPLDRRAHFYATWSVIYEDRVISQGEVHPNDRPWRYASFEREAMFRAEQAAALIPDGAA